MQKGDIDVIRCDHLEWMWSWCDHKYFANTKMNLLKYSNGCHGEGEWSHLWSHKIIHSIVTIALHIHTQEIQPKLQFYPKLGNKGIIDNKLQCHRFFLLESNILNALPMWILNLGTLTAPSDFLNFVKLFLNPQNGENKNWWNMILLVLKT